MPIELGILDLLRVYGFDDRLKTKLVRHQDARYDIQSLLREGWFDLYQRLQSRPVFSGCDQIVSFVGDGSTRARFVGVYKVLSESKSSVGHVPKECPYREWEKEDGYAYELAHQAEYSDLEGRAVIDWPNPRAWHQYPKNMRVVEVLPKGRVLEPFGDYLDFSLTNPELIQLTSNPASHRDWKSSLAAVSGVYLIMAQTTGHQYVGSAYGLDGIWGRWYQYAVSGHGGNMLLQELMTKDTAYPAAFRYSVLQVLPKSTTATEVIQWERQYKIKLGSRATGLNLN